MKKTVIVFGLIVLLMTGCAQKERACFYVTDELISAPQKHYSISVCLPEGMLETVSGVQNECRLFEAPDESYYVVTQVLQDCTAAEAIRQMTGEDAKSLGALCTKTMSMPEYRFSWCMEGETGMLTCTGIVAEDEDTCYCVEFCAQENQAKACASQREQVLASFGLYEDEGF